MEQNGQRTDTKLYSTEAFELLSDLWAKVGWNQKYTYTFTWMGVPVIQMPEDLVRLQEVVHRIQPDVIVETGIAHGGSLIFYASLLETLGKGRVIGVDIEIRPHNRERLESHPLFERISLIEGSSVDPEIVAAVRDQINEGDTVLVILDSAHHHEHVVAELEAYSDLVTPGSYIIAMDGVMELVADVPRGEPGWATDNPTTAAKEFADKHEDFVIEQPEWSFNESDLGRNITYAPGGFLRRVAEGDT